MQVIDSGADLNAYAKAGEGCGCGGGCCGSSNEDEPAASSCCATKPAAAACGCGCDCSADPADSADAAGIHEDLADLMQRYNLNDYAASYRIFAVKPAR